MPRGLVHVVEELPQRHRQLPHATVAPAPATAQSISALPLEVDLALYAGDDFAMTVTLTNPDGSAADLTGAVAESQIRSKAGAADPPAASFTCSIAANVVSLALAGTDTQALSGPYVWDCQITWGTGTKTTPIGGACIFTADVSRP